MTTTMLLLALFSAGSRSTSTTLEACDALTGPQRARVAALSSRLHPYDCCDDTIAHCLDQAPVCPVVRRLARQICAQVAAGKTDAEIEHALTRRGQSVLGVSRPVAIAVDPAMCAGEAEAPVVVTVYACSRCPFCSKLVPELHREIVEGALRGKAKICLRLFPIKDHPGSLEGGLALQAAARSGGFWPYILYLYAHFDAFSVERLDASAEAAGVPLEAFARLRGDAALREALAASKREGLRNKVTSTPTVFIDGRRYHSELERSQLVDIIDEVYESRVSRARP
ncbi:MAG: thioredoxin domain-containing protein [Pseudomonadota bacterium]